MGLKIVPGSILCKALSSIGCYLGFNALGCVAGGLAVASGSFAISIVGSCATVPLVQYLLQKFEKLREFELLKRRTRAIVSGLLGSVILSPVYTCLNLSVTYGFSVMAAFIEIAFFCAFDLFPVPPYQSWYGGTGARFHSRHPSCGQYRLVQGMPMGVCGL